MTVVSGRIVLEEDQRGIGNLVVELRDISDGEPASRAVAAEMPTRLGSTFTDGQGRFRLELPCAENAERTGRARHTDQVWNLQLIVSAPERPRDNGEPVRLFTSSTRRNSGCDEHFLVQLPRQLLTKAGVPVPGPVESAAEKVAKRIANAAALGETTGKAVDDVSAAELTRVRERREYYRKTVQPIIEKGLSTVSARERDTDGYVAPGDDIAAKSFDAIRKRVEALTASNGSGEPVRQRTRLVLSAEKAGEIIPDGSSEPVTLSEEELEEKLGTQLDKPVALYRSSLPPDPCRPRTRAEECLFEAEGDETEPGSVEPPPDGSGDVPGDGVDGSAGVYVARLIDRMVSPENPVEFGPQDVLLDGRLRPDQVAASISGIQFEPGPADVPAFYDFHDLQIAFEPVWQEALDDGLLADVEAAYDRFVELGGEAAESAVQGAVADLDGIAMFEAVMDVFGSVGSSTEDAVPAKVAANVMISREEWKALPKALRAELVAVASHLAQLRTALAASFDPENLDIPDIVEQFFTDFQMLLMVVNNPQNLALRTQIRLRSADADRIVAHARRLILERESHQPFRPTHAIVQALRKRARRSYPFRHFAASSRARSVNFGILATYRQQWTPVTYQVGELVSTIPLAPKEIRKFAKKTVITRKRSQKEVESNLSSQRVESEERSRAEAEIQARARARTNFSLTNKNSIEIPELLEASQTSSFSTEAEKHSQSVKKEFREAIVKSAQEFKNERRLEISAEESLLEEVSESGEIQNPNDEIPVTFLFYELQRRFRVSEKIHQLRSVVLVAQEVPTPGQIDEDWLIEHDWILNRVLLDDSFRPALTYVSTSLVSENIALQEMRDGLFRHRKVVEELREEVADRRALAGLRYAALQRQIERTARSAESGGGLFGFIGDVVGSVPLVGSTLEAGVDLLTGGSDEAAEAAQLREGAARDAFEREEREEQAIALRLQQAISTLEALQRQYADRLAEYMRELTQVERLKVHIRQNILHYMQAIWAHEPDDQRYLRLRNVPVPVFAKDKAMKLYELLPAAQIALSDFVPPGSQSYEVVTNVGTEAPDEIETAPLSEVADLDHPLGFKGNYMIFPLTKPNAITEFMMDPYVTVAASDYGLSDPDPVGNMTLDEFADYVCCLKAHYEEQASGESEDDVGAPDPFDELRPVLLETLEQLLESPLRDQEEIIVPTGSLYIEALPGAHPILEDFKLLHRAIDVKKVQAEVRKQELENVRRAARILSENLEDPDIEAKYLFQGDGVSTVIAPGGPPQPPGDGENP